MHQVTVGVIVGNRGFFPDHLCDSGRQQILAALDKAGIKAVALTPEDTKLGTVESLDDARKCAALFRAHRDEIDGVLVTLPNFGDERAVANSLRLADLRVPVLIHAFADDVGKMTIADRRDSFCGKISVCNNLLQYNIPFSLTQQHTLSPDAPAFAEDLAWFAGVCRVVRGLKGARIGAVGTRPPNFNTVRYSEKLLEMAGVTVEPLDLSEVLGRIERLADDDRDVQAWVAGVTAYVPCQDVPSNSILKMAKLGVVLDKWIREQQLVATAIQCWTAMEEYLGVVPCTVMSLMSSGLVPSACEVDVPGALSMYMLQLASGTPSALLDWNNNYDDDPDKVILFHCSNLPKGFLEKPRMSFQSIIAGDVGQENAYGTVVGKAQPGHFTYARLSTDETQGAITGYVGEAEFTNDRLLTFGGYGVARIQRLQVLLEHICRHGHEHHVAVSMSSTSRIIAEACQRYLGWNIYRHS